MGYGLMGLVHAESARVWSALVDAARGAGRDERGQGTVEYVALILLVAVVLAGVVAATKKTSLGSGDIGKAIMEKIKDAMDGVSK
jgi:Flp pilus assembly pilin Flp